MVSQAKNFDPKLYYIPQVRSNGNYYIEGTGPAPVDQYQVTNLMQQQYGILQQGAPHRQNWPAPPRPQAEKPEPRPVPMEIDPSIRCEHIHYMNKPQNNDLAVKRPPAAAYTGTPQKFQRQFYIATGNIEQTTDGNDIESPYPISVEEQGYFEAIEQEAVAELLRQ